MCRCSNNTNISSLAKVLSRKKMYSVAQGWHRIYFPLLEREWYSLNIWCSWHYDLFLSPIGTICRIWFTTAHPVCRNCNMTSSLIVMDSSIRRPWKFSAFNIPVGIDRNREAELFIVIDSGLSVAADDDDWRNKWRSILCSRCLAWRGIFKRTAGQKKSGGKLKKSQKSISVS